MALCPCGSHVDFSVCCEPFLNETQFPKTPEALMRSRYMAYSLARIDYIIKTMREKAAKNFDVNAAKKWANSVQFQSLIVESVHFNFVTFFARFSEADSQNNFIYERSEFKQIDGKWFYVDGVRLKPEKNNPCPCGSGKKFKHCCQK